MLNYQKMDTFDAKLAMTTMSAMYRKGSVSAPISGKMKLADLIDLDYRLLRILSRLEINLGFGEASISQVCQRSGVDEKTFIFLCKAYTDSSFKPSASELKDADVNILLKYLKRSHKYYVEMALVALQKSLERLLECCSEPSGKVIRKFYTDYKNELERHFDFEEQSVFPYVEALCSGAIPSGSSTFLDDEHNDIDEKINDLKNIVMKYLPENVINGRIMETVSYLFLLREDLQSHTAVEDNILMPMIKMLEDSYGRK